MNVGDGDSAMVVAPAPLTQLTLGDEVLEIDLDLIDASPFQSRTENKEALDELAKSIQQDGQLQPVLVRPKADGRFELVFGHRRVAALRKLGAQAVRAWVENLDDQGALRALIVENLKRDQLSPLDEARQFARAQDILGWSAVVIARAIGRSPAYVRDRLKLLELDTRAQAFIASRIATPAQARMLEHLVQIPGALEGAREWLSQGQRSDEQVARYVDDCFRQFTIPLDERTPFAWREYCRQNACLGRAPGGEHVCTNPANYLAAVAAVHKPTMDRAVEQFRAKTGPKEGFAGLDLPLFYDLSPLKPYGRHRQLEVEGFAACPVDVARSYLSDGEAMTWSAHLPMVANKDACRACPAWQGEGPGRAILVSAPSTQLSYSREPEVHLLCMDSACRRAKHEEGQTASQRREQERLQRREGQQAELIAKARRASDKLAPQRNLVLAGLMCHRVGVRQEPELRWEYKAALERLGINLVELAGNVIRSLVALPEQELYRIHAEALVAGFDRAMEYGSKWVPSRLDATIELFRLQEDE